MSPFPVSLTVVAVGTAVSRRPPHRSRRAGLPHRAPALDDEAQSRLRIRLTDARGWQPSVGDSSEPRLGDHAHLAAPIQGAVPESVFADFAGTTGLSDFPGSFIAVFPLSSSRHGPRRASGPNPGSPGFRVRCFGACMGSSTPRDPYEPRDLGSHGLAFRMTSARRHPGQ